MLPKGARLVRRSDFQRIYRTGRGYYGPVLGLKATPGQTKQTRIAVVVSTSVSKKATVRNRLKRQLRALLASHLKSLPLLDVVVTAKPLALKQAPTQLAQHLSGILAQLSKKPPMPGRSKW